MTPPAHLVCFENRRRVGHQLPLWCAPGTAVIAVVSSETLGSICGFIGGQVRLQGCECDISVSGGIPSEYAYNQLQRVVYFKL